MKIWSLFKFFFTPFLLCLVIKFNWFNIFIFHSHKCDDNNGTIVRERERLFLSKIFGMEALDIGMFETVMITVNYWVRKIEKEEEEKTVYQKAESTRRMECWRNDRMRVKRKIHIKREYKASSNR